MEKKLVVASMDRVKITPQVSIAKVSNKQNHKRCY